MDASEGFEIMEKKNETWTVMLQQGTWQNVERYKRKHEQQNSLL